MSEHNHQYRGKEIRYREDDEEVSVSIEGTRIDVLREEGGYYTSLLPYSSYESLEALSEDLVNNWEAIKPSVQRRGEGGQ